MINIKAMFHIHIPLNLPSGSGSAYQMQTQIHAVKCLQTESFFWIKATFLTLHYCNDTFEKFVNSYNCNWRSLQPDPHGDFWISPSLDLHKTDLDPNSCIPGSDRNVIKNR